MDKHHSDQMKFEPLVIPQGELKVDPDHFITEEHFTLPMTRPSVPVHCTEPKVEPTEIVEVHHSSKKHSSEEEVQPRKSTKFAGSDLEELFEGN